MPRISEMIADTVDAWTERWKVRFHNFWVSLISIALEAFLNILHKAFKPLLAPFINDLKETDGIPDNLKPLFDEFTEQDGEVGAMLGMSMATGAGAGLTGAMLEPLFKQINQQMYRRIRSSIPAPPDLVMAYWRGAIDRDYLKGKLERSGYGDEWIEKIDELYKTLLNEGALRQLYLRGEVTEDYVRAELKRQGWDDDRITEAMKLWAIIPPLADMVRFADYSSFDPEVIAKWREFYDAPGWIAEPMALIGITGEWANKYWFSHWRQPGRFELGEMHRRKLITDDDVKLAYKTMGYSPYWQDKLLDLVKEVPTRVDVRRFWDMGTIDEARLREIYQAQGYYGKDQDDYVLWTKIYVAFPDLIARFKNGWITLGDCFNELTGLGMSTDRAEQLIQTKVKPLQEERTSTERNLTKAEIVKGIKKGVITVTEGLSLLIEMGYSETEAAFIISINVDIEESIPEIIAKRDLAKSDILNAVKGDVISISDGRTMLINLGYDAGEADILILTKLGLTSLTELDALLVGGSPTSYSGYKALVGKLKGAKGVSVTLPSPELIKTERELKAAKDALTNIQKTNPEPSVIAPYLQRLSELEQRYSQLLRGGQ